MQYNDEDVFVYQLMDMLVCDYNYKIVNVPGGKRDVWLANDQHERFPMIRLTSAQSTSIVFEKDYISKIKKALSIVIRSDKPLLIKCLVSIESKLIISASIPRATKSKYLVA